MKAVKVTAVELLKLLKVYSQSLLGTSGVVTTTWSLKPVTEPVTLLYSQSVTTRSLLKLRAAVQQLCIQDISDVYKSLDKRCLLVVLNFCDIQYKQASRRRSPKCPQRPVIHHERVTPVSLDRKVTVRLKEEAASSQA